jgi:hypothetical protein
MDPGSWFHGQGQGQGIWQWLGYVLNRLRFWIGFLG